MSNHGNQSINEDSSSLEETLRRRLASTSFNLFSKHLFSFMGCQTLG